MVKVNSAKMSVNAKKIHACRDLYIMVIRRFRCHKFKTLIHVLYSLNCFKPEMQMAKHMKNSGHTKILCTLYPTVKG